MRVLVTGGAGYIGSFTTRALQGEGHEVVVFDNLSYGHRQAVEAEIIEGDIADAAVLDALMASRRFDALIHFAAFIEAGESMVDAARFFRNNTATAITLLTVAAENRVDKVVFSSTAGIYGN